MLLKRILPLLLFVVLAAYAARQCCTRAMPSTSAFVRYLRSVSMLTPVPILPLKAPVPTPALPHYALIDLDAPHAPSLSQKRVGWRKGLVPIINARGQSIGSEQVGEYEESYVNGEGETVRMPETRKITHAFVYDKGAKRDLGTLGGNNSYGYCINDAGQVVGEADAKNNGSYPTLWQGRKMVQLPTENNECGEAHWINNQGDIAGETGNSACVWLHRKLYVFDAPPGTSSTAVCISDNGDVTGRQLWQEAGGSIRSQAFHYHQGKVRLLDALPGYTDSEADSVNNRGDVVGRVERMVDIPRSQPNAYTGGRINYVNHQMQRRAVLWRQGRCIDLNAIVPAGSGWELETASSINDLGYIVGTGILHKRTHTYLLKPLPAHTTR